MTRLLKINFKMGHLTYVLFDDYHIPTTVIILSGERVTINAPKRYFFFRHVSSHVETLVKQHNIF